MYNHEPPDYNCPFCRIVKAATTARFPASQTDVIYHSETATAFLALGRWPRNPVDVLVVPNQHFENLYDLPLDQVAPLHLLTRAIALALKGVYSCDGVSTRQHNEPAGDQDVWHYHVHVTPRFTQDGFYHSGKVEFREVERLEHADRLRRFVHDHHDEIFKT
jgi:histidine triad (HIT) family protein